MNLRYNKFVSMTGTSYKKG